MHFTDQLIYIYDYLFQFRAFYVLNDFINMTILKTSLFQRPYLLFKYTKCKYKPGLRCIILNAN